MNIFPLNNCTSKGWKHRDHSTSVLSVSNISAAVMLFIISILMVHSLCV